MLVNFRYFLKVGKNWNLLCGSFIFWILSFFWVISALLASYLNVSIKREGKSNKALLRPWSSRNFMVAHCHCHSRVFLCLFLSLAPYFSLFISPFFNFSRIRPHNFGPQVLPICVTVIPYQDLDYLLYVPRASLDSIFSSNNKKEVI